MVGNRRRAGWTRRPPPAPGIRSYGLAPTPAAGQLTETATIRVKLNSFESGFPGDSSQPSRTGPGQEPQEPHGREGGDPACLRNSPVLWTPSSPGCRTTTVSGRGHKLLRFSEGGGKNLPSSPKISGEQRGGSSIIGNVLLLCKEKAFRINDAIKMEFFKVSKRNQMTAGTLWKGAGLGGQGVHMLRPFAFSLAFPCFQKQESFFVKPSFESLALPEEGWQKPRRVGA